MHQPSADEDSRIIYRLPKWFAASISGLLLAIVIQTGSGLWWGSAITTKLDFVLASQTSDGAARSVLTTRISELETFVAAHKEVTAQQEKQIDAIMHDQQATDDIVKNIQTRQQFNEAKIAETATRVTTLEVRKP